MSTPFQRVSSSFFDTSKIFGITGAFVGGFAGVGIGSWIGADRVTKSKALLHFSNPYRYLGFCAGPILGAGLGGALGVGGGALGGAVFPIAAPIAGAALTVKVVYQKYFKVS